MSKSIIGALLVAMALTGCAHKPPTCYERFDACVTAAGTDRDKVNACVAPNERCKSDTHCAQVYGGEY